MNAPAPAALPPGVHPFRLAAADGVELVGDACVPAAGVERQVVLVHGFAEHRGRYAETISALLAAGCAVDAFDLRGHGDSGGRRGHVESFDDYRGDLARVVAARRRGDVPLVLFGHSLGGLVALDQVLFVGDGPYSALALSSPFLAPAFRVPPWKQAVAEVASHLPPWFGFPSGIDPAALSHDPAVVAAYRDDPKVLRELTASWYTSVSAAQEEADAGAERLRLPVLALLGGADPIADPEHTQRLFARFASADKRLVVYDGFLHEILNEVGRERVLADLVGWLGGR